GPSGPPGGDSAQPRVENPRGPDAGAAARSLSLPGLVPAADLARPLGGTSWNHLGQHSSQGPGGAPGRCGHASAERERVGAPSHAPVPLPVLPLRPPATEGSGEDRDGSPGASGGVGGANRFPLRRPAGSGP